MPSSHVTFLVAVALGGVHTHARVSNPTGVPPEPGVSWASAHYVDVTGDGARDQLVVDATGRLAVLVNAGARRFVRVEQDLPAVAPASYLVRDLDGDGTLDVYVVSAGANVALRGLGDGAFEDATDRLGLADLGRGRCAQFEDLDGDGRDDLLLENASGHVVFWAEGDGSFRRHAGASAASLPPASSAVALLDVPPGTIVAYAGAAPPPGYFLCDGSEVGRLDYPELFRACGVTYGAGNLTTTFNLPDLAGRFALGLSGGGTGAVLGEAGGALDHVHAGAAHTHDVPAHSHGLASHTHSGPSHTHSLANHTHGVPGHFHGLGTLSVSVNKETRRDAPYGGALNQIMRPSGDSPGSAGANMNMNVALSGSVGDTTSGNNGNSGFNTSGPSTSNTGGGGTQSTGAASPSTSSPSSVFATTAASAGNTGAANPPYLTINYIIKH